MQHQETRWPNDNRATAKTKQVDTFEFMDVLATSEDGDFEWLLDRHAKVGDER